MPTIQHSVLTGSDQHEPKGADTATVNQVYVSDGSGSGTWATWPFGWGFYEHDTAGQVFNTTPSVLQINGVGSKTNETQLPQGASALWDTTTNNIIPMAEGDVYLIRLSIPIASKTGSPTTFTLQCDIGGASSPTTVISTRDTSTAGAAPFNIQVAFPVFIGATAFANGVQFFGSTDSNSVTLGAGAGILITRVYGEL